jgi:hypothetical protein
MLAGNDEGVRQFLHAQAIAVERAERVAGGDFSEPVALQVIE